eukprot:TRINITY_DN4755_c0_g1_i1.p1 TRINITY_DN4755_c0_g1~~TRINITY_DN4755_c0_g1_i1.p1  ORF type:complete len:384 (+),score=86.10 TRINITY_DN4755_c0_g1_i1:81-1232(+)
MNAYGSIPAYPGIQSSSADTFHRKPSRQTNPIYTWITASFCMLLFASSLFSLYIGIMAARCSDPPYLDTQITNQEIPDGTKSAVVSLAVQRGNIDYSAISSNKLVTILDNHSSNEDGLKDIDSQRNIRFEGSSLFLDYTVEHGKWSLRSCLYSDLIVQLPLGLTSMLADAALFLEVERGDINIQAPQRFSSINILSVEDSDIYLSRFATRRLDVLMSDGDMYLENAVVDIAEIQSQAGVVRFSNVTGMSLNYQISTKTGNIQCQFVQTLGGRLSVETISGSVNLIQIIRTNITVIAENSDVMIRVYDDQMSGTFTLVTSALTSIGGDGEYTFTSTSPNTITGTIGESGQYNIYVATKGAITLRVQASSGSRDIADGRHEPIAM